VDPERQVLIGVTEPKPMSKYKVDDKLINGSLTNASSAVMNDRYYLAYQPSGETSNTNVLLNELQMELEWGEDNYPVSLTDIANFLTVDNLTTRKVYAFSSDGLCYQYETPGQTTDAGTAIIAAITTQGYHAELWNKINRRRVGVVTDPGTEVLSITTTWYPGALQFTDGTINLSLASGSYTWIWEQGGSMAGGTSAMFQVTLSGSLPGAFSMYAMQIETKALEVSGAVAGGL
jgi:hypothetical protein